MSQTYEFYAERAREAADEAAAATLDNVRDRNLRAEKTWSMLAEQARKVKADRNLRAEKTWSMLAEQARKVKADRVKAEETRAARIAAEEAAAAEPITATG